ncbi:hypothetical protein NVV93_11830 [Pseudomonas sp. LS44]|uniref:PA1571 family protein n=1 Tax=Pseudomonas sp. LS44 TaxID=1357074 RepID=UPI00215A588B|nr:PA1571 family protein [Pseudomonas sp. LS44]UVE16307.1 hypothetical protein NVV93_11830 [Pseudomonas sp. LS44]
MSLHNIPPQPRVTPPPPQQVVGGSIIDAQGREIPITEQMIQRACQELDKGWVPAPKHD